MDAQGEDNDYDEVTPEVPPTANEGASTEIPIPDESNTGASDPETRKTQ